MKTETPAYIIAVFIIIASTALIIHGDSVPAEFYGALFGALGIAGGVSIPKKDVPPANG